ncbi:hypothetical protein RHMOL_Rhmol01G0025100 [Rhododendron molle]|uniref:Uncharacterized protein n=1 Tax=Rhododendron molle TaxID=49168 RepID=A0ACC0PZ75_RHOML|nr:hypothetical protein RHMOL_Rhmol01G0025100 [Rhododendron molle]
MERVDGDKDEWIEKRKKDKRTPLAISSLLCLSSTTNEVGVLERCEDSGASAVVKETNKDDAGTVPPPVVLHPVSCVSTPIVQGRVAIDKSFLPWLSVDQHVFESLQRSLWKAISLDLIKWWVIPHHLRPLEVKLGRSFERK